MSNHGYIIFVPYDDREAASMLTRVPYYHSDSPHRIDNWDIDRWIPVLPPKTSSIAIWHWPQARENYMPLNLRATLTAHYGGTPNARLYGDCIITRTDKTSLSLSHANLALGLLAQCHSLAGSLMLNARARSIGGGNADPISLLNLGVGDAHTANGDGWLLLDKEKDGDV